MVKDDKYCLVIILNHDGLCLYEIFKKGLISGRGSFKKKVEVDLGSRFFKSYIDYKVIYVILFY